LATGAVCGSYIAIFAWKIARHALFIYCVPEITRLTRDACWTICAGCAFE